MSFDFGGHTSKFNLSSPLRLENIFLLFSGGVLLLGGMIFLFSAKSEIGNDLTIKKRQSSQDKKSIHKSP